MMKQIQCPRCGTINNGNDHFCRNCGAPLQQSRPINPNPRPGSFYQGPPVKRHHPVMTFFVILLISLGALAGTYTYKTNSFPFGSKSVTRSTVHNSAGSTSASSDQQVVRTLWQRIANKVGSANGNGGSSDLTNLFQDSDNKSLTTLNKWAKDNNQENGNTGTTVESIKPSDFTDNDGHVTYHVRYDFKTGSHHNIQIFEWKTTVKNGKIMHMNSPKTPIRTDKE